MIKIEILTRDNEKHNDDYREKTLDDKQWWRRGEDGRPESGRDEMKMLRE